jgi:hypothetical protein
VIWTVGFGISILCSICIIATEDSKDNKIGPTGIGIAALASIVWPLCIFGLGIGVGCAIIFVTLENYATKIISKWIHAAGLTGADLHSEDKEGYTRAMREARQTLSNRELKFLLFINKVFCTFTNGSRIDDGIKQVIVEELIDRELLE